MDPHAASPSLTVSNLVPVFAEPVIDGGGSFEPRAAAALADRAVTIQPMPAPPTRAPEPPQRAVVVEQAPPELEPRVARLVSPPERFDAAEPVEQRSAFTYDLLRDEDTTWAERRAADDAAGIPQVDYDALRRRDIAKELLRARLIGIAEQRERRSAYELAFLMLVAAVAVLLAAPPLVQVLLAAHGTAA